MELQSQEDLDKAIKHNNENMGRRYIEVLSIGKTEVDQAMSRQPNVSCKLSSVTEQQVDSVCMYCNACYVHCNAMVAVRLGKILPLDFVSN